MQLPVHPTQVDPTYFVHGVPQQFPNFPVVEVPPSIGQDAGYILGLAALMIQQNAAANPARTFFANLVTRDAWQNQEAAEVATRVFQFVDFAIQTSPGNVNKQAIVEEAVASTVQMLTAVFVSKYQAGLSQYITAGLATQLNNMVAQYNQMLQNCHALYQQQQQTMMYGRQPGYGAPAGGGYGIPNTGYGIPGGGMRPGMVPSGHAGMHNIGSHSPLAGMGRIDAPRNTTANRNVATATPVYTETNAMPLSGRYGNRVTGVTEPATPAPTTRIVELSGGPGQPTEVRRAEVAPAVVEQNGGVVIGGRFFKEIGPAPTAAATVAPVVIQEPAQEKDMWVTYPDDPYREVCWRDGTMLRPAAISGWTVARTAKNPYPRAYNPYTHLLMHVKTNDGLVHEHLEPIKEETRAQMEPYLQHELNQDLREAETKRQAAKDGKSLVDWSQMIDLTPAEGKPYSVHTQREPALEGEEGGEQVASSIPVKAVTDVISAHDVRSAETVVMVRHPELQKLAKTSTIEFYCEAVSPRLTINELGPAMEQLRSCSTFAELTHNLSKVRDHYPEDAPIWDEVERRLTNGINRILNIGFSIPWTIDSFTDDAVDLAGALQKQYGDDVAQKYLDIAMQVIDQSLCTAVQDPAAELAEVGVESEVEVQEGVEVETGDDAVTNHVIAFANRCSVTKVPYEFSELNVAFQGTALVDRNELPELHKLIVAIFARTEDHPVTFTDRFIKTSDGTWLSLDMALLSEGSYLITQHTF